jgi:hypothetical protein
MSEDVAGPAREEQTMDADTIKGLAVVSIAEGTK